MRNLRRGFTLLELMIAITLMLIVMLMLRQMFTGAQEMYLRAAQRVQVYSQARVALDMIEQDLLRMEVGDENGLQLRSLTAEFANPDKIRSSGAYSDLQDWLKPSDYDTTKIREFLSFTGSATWYERDKKRFVTGNAEIVYYLRRRRAPAGEVVDGAYLVRRILPKLTLAQIVQAGIKGSQASIPTIEPHEDEIAVYVYAARVFVDDQAAAQKGALGGNYNLDIMPECIKTHRNATWLWVRTAPTPPPPPTPKGQRVLRLQIPPRGDQVQFGGVYRSMVQSPDRGFVASRADIPAVVMVELTFINRNFMRDGDVGRGTYRTFSRAVHLPFSGPPRRLDDIDLGLMR